MSVVRISSDLYEKLKEIAEKSNKNLRDIVEEALRVYLMGSVSTEKEIKSIKQSIINLQYDTRCYRCKKELKAGELAYWIKYEYSDGSARSFIYCLDCYYQSSALKEQYLTKKKLEAIVRELRKEADELAQEVVRLRSEVKLYNVRNELIRLYNDLVKHLTDEDLKNKMSEFIERLDTIEKRIDDVLEDLKYVSMKKKKKEAEFFEL